MEPEAGPCSPRSPPPQLSWRNLSRNLLLAYQSFGVVYGDLSTSPLYVYTSTFVGKLQNHRNEETIFGAFSLIFWTLTLIPLLKYIFILLSADDNGEGGVFALYSLLCRHARLSLLPNQQAADEELTAYKYGPSSQIASSPMKRFFEKHKRLRTALLIVVLCGACMVIGDGVLTPAISVLSSVSGLQVTDKKIPNEAVILLACIILVGLFALQHCGTHRVAFLFAPIVVMWLISIFAIGLYNTIYWNPKIVVALSPHYIIKFFRETGKDGWIALGGILLSITGTEAMFADLGHFTALSIRLAFVFVVYPCLVVQYMGQAAFLSKNPSSIPTSFYDSIPKTLFWPVFVIATLAAIVGSQAVITATFSIIKQCNALGCFPRVKIVHTSRHMFGQIYIPEINWILMIICLAVTIGFRDTTMIGNAYGIACVTVMFVSTWLATLVIIFVWQKGIFFAAAFLLLFGSIEGVYLSSSFTKVPQGGWLPLVLSLIFMGIMYIWHYGTRKKYNFYGTRTMEHRDTRISDETMETLRTSSYRALQSSSRWKQMNLGSRALSLRRWMVVISTRPVQSTSSLIVSEQMNFEISDSIQSSKSSTLQSLRSAYEEENPPIRRRVRFQLPQSPGMDPSVREELVDLIQAKEAGVAYIMGHSYVKARRSSSFLKKAVIDIGYSFLRKNCRGPSVALNIPHISLIEVGMIYYV